MQTSFEIRGGNRYVYIRTKQVGDRLLRAEQVLLSKVGTPWQSEENRLQFLDELKDASEDVDKLIEYQEQDPSLSPFLIETLEKPTEKDEKMEEKDKQFIKAKRKQQFSWLAQNLHQLTNEQLVTLSQQIETTPQ